MPDIATLVNQMMTDGTGQMIATNPRAQFGPPTRPLLGATLLPEQLRDRNEYTEDGITYRTVIANSSTRYSPPQKKGSALIGRMRVELAESDIAGELTAQQYDTLVKLLNAGGDIEAIANLVRFLDTSARMPLAILNEQQRWQAIVDAKVLRRGDDGYADDVDYPNPAGHRATVGGDWKSDSYDPMDDIYAMVEMAAAKGYTISRMIGSTKVRSILKGNAKIAARSSKITINAGSVTASTGRITNADLSGVLADDELPPFEVYDGQYLTQTGAAHFLKRDVLVLVATTGRDQSIDVGQDQDPLMLPNTLGYVGIGVPTGQANPGIRLRMEAFDNKPPRVETEGWQTALPVIMDPEAIYVLKGIS